MSSITTPNQKQFRIFAQGTFFKGFLGKILGILRSSIMKKINLEVMCKRDRFGYWNLCKRLPSFVNVAALLNTHVITTIMGMMAILIPQNGSRADRGVSCCFHETAHGRS